jgi:hypothetical protein
VRGLYLPATQSMQTLTSALAGDTAVAYLPTKQSMQATSVSELYLPVAHATQRQLALDPLEGWLLPAPHVVQTVLLASGEYLPTSQYMHAAREVCPACAENRALGHPLQSLGLSWRYTDFCFVMYVPATQSMHATSLPEL